MKSKTILLMVVFFAMALCMAARTCAAPMGTAFTYQGFLMDAKGGKPKPADGPHDFQFSLFADPNDGNQVGGIISKDNVDVQDGYFMVRLDFGDDPNIFNGDARWLEINVRPDGGGSFTTLSPRQELTPTPYALHTRGILVDDSGNVGIGTTSPTEKLGVVGNARIDGNLKVTGEQEVDGGVAADGFTAGDTTHYGHGVVRTTGEVPNDDLMFRVGGSSSPATRNSRTEGAEIMRLTDDGNLGIGTTNPATRLQVNGIVTANFFDGDGSALFNLPGAPGNVPIRGIIMWSGTIANIPAGWALCNGQVHNGVQTPDLTDMFIVGAGGQYPVNDTGGVASHTLTIGEMPRHHHTYQRHMRTCHFSGNTTCSVTDALETHTTEDTGGNQPHENRPPFFALAYIMRTN